MAHSCGCQCSSSPVEIARTPAPIRAEQTVEAVTRHHAGTLDVMEQMGINHCCGGHLTLTETAAAAGIPVETLIRALNEAQTASA